MLKVGGVTISTPSSYSVGLQDISKAERNSNGNMIIERITTKRKIEIGYNYLSSTAMATLLTAIAGVSFTVEYPDPETGALRTGSFYSGDRNCGAIDYKGNVMRWKDLKFSLVEI